MAKRMSIMLIIVTIIFGGAVAWYFVKQAMIAKFLGSMKYPPAVINVSTVKLSDWQPYYESVGTLVAPQSVNVLPAASGIVKNIYFKSGDDVRKGQVLVRLDDSQEQADLVSDTASLQLARITYQRDLLLFKRHALSKQVLDTDYSKLIQAKAKVTGDRVAIENKTVLAPFSGHIGLREVSLGEYISNTGSNSIAMMEQVDPLYVDFQLSQQYVRNIKVNQSITVMIDGYADKTYQGKISAWSVGVDKDSRMITVRATIPNKNRELYSGMFVDVHVLLPTHKATLVVPQTAITYNLYGDLIYVVKNGRAIETFVTVGQRRGNDIEIVKGLKAGDQIVTAGQLKLFNNAPVIISKEAEPH